MAKFTKQDIDTNYSKVSAYMIEKGFYDIAKSNINLLFAISQSEEARDVHDFFSGRNLPIVEGFHDLDASFELIKLGFHKQAFASLRMGLDNGLLAAYWNAVGYDTPEFKRLISSKEQTPRKDKKFWSPIRRLCGVEDFYATFSFEQTIKDLNSRLNSYVHTKGFRYSTTGEFQRRIRTQTRTSTATSGTSYSSPPPASLSPCSYLSSQNWLSSYLTHTCSESLDHTIMCLPAECFSETIQNG